MVKYFEGDIVTIELRDGPISGTIVSDKQRDAYFTQEIGFDGNDPEEMAEADASYVVARWHDNKEVCHATRGEVVSWHRRVWVEFVL